MRTLRRVVASSLLLSLLADPVLLADSKTLRAIFNGERKELDAEVRAGSKLGRGGIKAAEMLPPAETAFRKSGGRMFGALTKEEHSGINTFKSLPPPPPPSTFSKVLKLKASESLNAGWQRFSNVSASFFGGVKNEIGAARRTINKRLTNIAAAGKKRWENTVFLARQRFTEKLLATKAESAAERQEAASLTRIRAAQTLQAKKTQQALVKPKVNREPFASSAVSRRRGSETMNESQNQGVPSKAHGAGGQTNRVLGVNESKRRFLPAEKKTAEYLANKGHYVEALPEGRSG